MADKRRFLDVWIVDSNTVYKEVPFTVVIDWVQQGRLLEDDMVKPSGTKDWFRLGASPDFAPYLPHPEPFRADDQAEALEPVQLAFSWKRRPDEDEGDVDMIPLIDVSLVLLIFFMMISTVAMAGAIFQNPTAVHGDVSLRDFWVGIKGDANGDPVSYHLGWGDREVAKTKDWDEFLRKLDEELGQTTHRVQVTMLGDENLKFDHEMKLMVELEKRRLKVERKKIGVTDRGPGP